MATLRSTQPHFVRCIIPNETKSPGELTTHFVYLLHITLPHFIINHEIETWHKITPFERKSFLTTYANYIKIYLLYFNFNS